ncbi:MAG: hypothetical protein IBV52_01675 [Candidatus Bathyarchaeota archaeon]
MSKPKYRRSEQPFSPKEQLKKHKTDMTREPLPMWCKGIMGGCVNCGGCIP